MFSFIVIIDRTVYLVVYTAYKGTKATQSGGVATHKLGKNKKSEKSL